MCPGREKKSEPLTELSWVQPLKTLEGDAVTMFGRSLVRWVNVQSTVEAEGSLGGQGSPPFMEEPERSCPVLEVVASETSFLLNFPDSSKHEIVSRYYFYEQKEIIVNK